MTCRCVLSFLRRGERQKRRAAGCQGMRCVRRNAPYPTQPPSGCCITLRLFSVGRTQPLRLEVSSLQCSLSYSSSCVTRDAAMRPLEANSDCTASTSSGARGIFSRAIATTVPQPRPRTVFSVDVPARLQQQPCAFATGQLTTRRHRTFDNHSTINATSAPLACLPLSLPPLRLRRISKHCASH